MLFNAMFGAQEIGMQAEADKILQELQQDDQEFIQFIRSAKMNDDTGDKVAQLLDGKLKTPILNDIINSNTYNGEKFEVNPDVYFNILIGTEMHSLISRMQGSKAVFVIR